jgi:glycosyltransferase involved in cell wall biosynthesis
MYAAQPLRAAVIIPALNEADVIEPLLASLPRIFQQVIVVDNGSTDDTAARARRAGAILVSEPRRGYGRACLAGIDALRPEIDVVVFLDADLSDDPAEAPALLDLISAGHDFVVGSRVNRAQPGALGAHQRFAAWLTSLLIRLLWGVRFTDLGPFRAIRRDALQRLHMRDLNFGWTVEMQVRSAQLGLRCAEVDVSYRPRRAGKSKIAGTLGGSALAGAKICWTIARLAFTAPSAKRP